VVWKEGCRFQTDNAVLPAEGRRKKNQMANKNGVQKEVTQISKCVAEKQQRCPSKTLPTEPVKKISKKLKGTVEDIISNHSREGPH